MGSSKRVIERMDETVHEIVTRFDSFLERFNHSETFTGPSIYFHNKAIACLKRHRTSVDAILSEELFDWIYATLASWGMHRMGPGKTKLLPIEQIKQSVRAERLLIEQLENIDLPSVSTADIGGISDQIWKLIQSIHVSAAEATIVANTKFLHHILPNLVPPIDRTYTYKCFYGRTNLSISEQDAFQEVYGRFHQIAIAKRDRISQLIGADWNTSSTKTIDNVIVGRAIQRKEPIGA